MAVAVLEAVPVVPVVPLVILVNHYHLIHRNYISTPAHVAPGAAVGHCTTNSSTSGRTMSAVRDNDLTRANDSTYTISGDGAPDILLINTHP